MKIQIWSSPFGKKFYSEWGGWFMSIILLRVYVHTNQVILVVEKLLHIACLQWIKAWGKHSRPSLEPTQLSWWYWWGCSPITENDPKKVLLPEHSDSWWCGSISKEWINKLTSHRCKRRKIKATKVASRGNIFVSMMQQQCFFTPLPENKSSS